MANKKLPYIPEAFPTSIGWAHPITGEQLTATSGLEDAIDFYIPNAHSRSFIDPNGVVDAVLGVVVQSTKATMIVHSIKEIESVEWDFGDGSAPVVGGKMTRYVYPQLSEYTVTANITFSDESTLQLTKELQVGQYVPGAVEDISINFEVNGDVTISWDEPQDTGGLDITGYRVNVIIYDDMFNLVSQTVENQVGTTKVIENFDPLTQIIAVRLRAINERFTAPFRDENAIELYVTPPSHVTDVEASSQASGTEIILTWAPPALDGFENVLSYGEPQPTITKQETAFYVKINDGVDTSVTNGVALTGFVDKTLYNFKVIAENACGLQSQVTPTSEIDYVSGGYAGEVFGFGKGEGGYAGGDGVSIGTGSLTAIWGAPTITGETPITGYLVELLDEAGTTVLDSETVTDFIKMFVGLTNGVNYRLRVSAVNTAGPGLSVTSGLYTPDAA